jgi:hypothetical protein
VEISLSPVPDRRDARTSISNASSIPTACRLIRMRTAVPTAPRLE